MAEVGEAKELEVVERSSLLLSSGSKQSDGRTQRNTTTQLSHVYMYWCVCVFWVLLRTTENKTNQQHGQQKTPNKSSNFSAANTEECRKKRQKEKTTTTTTRTRNEFYTLTNTFALCGFSRDSAIFLLILINEITIGKNANVFFNIFHANYTSIAHSAHTHVLTHMRSRKGKIVVLVIFDIEFLLHFQNGRFGQNSTNAFKFLLKSSIFHLNFLCTIFFFSKCTFTISLNDFPLISYGIFFEIFLFAIIIIIIATSLEASKSDMYLFS